MAIQSKNQFDRVPSEILNLIVENLEPTKETIETITGIKDWQKDPLLDRQRELILRHRSNLVNVHTELKERFIERLYPQELIQLFRNCNISIARLPELESEHLEHEYITGLKPEDMTHHIMRHRHPRPGISFYVKGYGDGVFTVHRSIPPYRNEATSGVLTIFRRLLPNTWRVGTRDLLPYAIHMRSGASVNYDTLSSLLTGQHPSFRIGRGLITPEDRLPAQQT